MIRITIQLLSANTGKATILGVMDIWNKGDRPAIMTKHNYGFRIYKRNTANPTGKVHKDGVLEDYPREAYSVWVLVSRILQQVYGKGKP